MNQKFINMENFGLFAGTIGFISFIIGLIILIVFFVMAVALGNISRNLKNVNRLLSQWGAEKGYGITFKCDYCGKLYEGKLLKCPHCGAEKIY